MSIIKSSIDYVLQNEGGFTDDENDSGGATNWGITHDDLSRFRSHSVSTLDVKNMTKDEACQIYEKFYWNPMELNNISDQGIATCIFDIGVNRGISRGVKYAQEVVQTVQDGKMGPKTIVATNLIQRSDFIHKYYNLVANGYQQIILNHPSQHVFYKGWMARANRLLTLI